MNVLDSLQVNIYYSSLLGKWISEARIDGHDLCVFYKEYPHQLNAMMGVAKFLITATDNTLDDLEKEDPDA